MTHQGWRETDDGRELLRRVRSICVDLPETQEKVDGFDHTTFRVRKKSFAMAGMGEDGRALSIKSDPPNQALLVSQGPYYRTPYIGHHGWISIADPLSHDWHEIGELIRDAWRLAAPRALVAKLGGQ